MMFLCSIMRFSYVVRSLLVVVAMMSVVKSWGMCITVVVACRSFMGRAMLTMSLFLRDRVYLLGIEPDDVLDLLEHLFAAEEVFILSNKTALRPQALLFISLHGLLIEVMQQVDQHFQHNLSDHQRVQHVDYTEHILVLHLDSRDLLVEVSLDLIEDARENVDSCDFVI